MLLFSDLHLSPSTFSTCMKVLRFVHEEALRRKTTVGFLGDFFDRVYNEGTLPVDILNELMRYFSDEWRVPMIMIPGNHDYFDASETEHGLSPFQYASPQYIRILDTPTMIGTQLWVPWRRNLVELQSIIAEHSSCGVIFGHFDIIGFKLNAARVSSEGLSASIFPDGIPVYTGHYHTPQVHGNIRYLGSPYQLSLSEAEDKKSLLVLDDHWHVSDTIPLDIGRKQYKWTANELLTRSGILRANDRVSVACSLTENSVSDLLADLKERGVNVQIRRLETETATRVENQKDMAPLQLLQAYADRAAIDTKSKPWQDILQWMKDHPSEQISTITNAVTPMKIEISGLGPFKGPITMSMSGDGFTLVSAECNETRGASNGAGKSIVTAGAWLWACTGQIDGRGPLAFDSETSIIHKGSDTASVSVFGIMNGAPWKIMRTLSCTGHNRKHHIRLFINHVERTRSTLSGTQRAIASELFGLDVSGAALHQWLLRNSVWSQQSVSRWLDANDTQAKQEIHALANMDNWKALSDFSKDLVKKVKEQVSMGQYEKQAAKDVLAAAIQRYEERAEQAARWNTSQQDRISRLQTEIECVRKTYNESVTPIGESPLVPALERELETATTKLEHARTHQAELKAQTRQIERSIPEDWLTKDIAQEEETFKSIRAPNVDEAQTKKLQCAAEKRARAIQLDNKRKEFKEFQERGECSACGRAFERGDNHHNHMRTLKTQLEACRAKTEKANAAHQCVTNIYEQVKNESDEYQRRLTYIQQSKSYQKIQQTLSAARETFETLSKHQTELKNKVDAMRQKNILYNETRALLDQLQRTVQSSEHRLRDLRQAQCPHNTNDNEKKDAQHTYTIKCQTLAQLRVDLNNAQAMTKWTGPRGVQTFAMENTVLRLASVMTHWLRRFFGTEDIKMRVKFDEKERLKRHIDCPAHTGVMSGGQWRRCQLASFMAWKEMSGASMPLLILDEACTSMDTPGIRSVQQTFRDWCDEDPNRTCFFITHEPEQHRDTSIYNRHIKILHKRGRSHVSDETSSYETKRQKIRK